MKIALLIVFSAVFLLIFSLIFSGVLMSLIKIPAATKRAFGSRLLGLKMVVKWFALLWVGLIVEFITCCITPFVVLFANHQTGRLPIGFRWLETPDALLPGYPAGQGFDHPIPVTWLAWYRQSVSWLWRNRCYRFASEQMGVRIAPDEQIAVFGDAAASEYRPDKLGGYIKVSRNCFECERLFRFAGVTWVLRMGYKMRQSAGMFGYAQHVMRILPIRK